MVYQIDVIKTAWNSLATTGGNFYYIGKHLIHPEIKLNS